MAANPADVDLLVATPEPVPDRITSFVDFLTTVQLPAMLVGDVGGYRDGQRDYLAMLKSVPEHDKTIAHHVIDEDWPDRARDRYLHAPAAQTLADLLPQLFAHLNMDHCLRILDPVVDEMGCREWVQSLVLRPMARLLQAYLLDDPMHIVANRHRHLSETMAATYRVDNPFGGRHDLKVEAMLEVKNVYEESRQCPTFELAPPLPEFQSTLCDVRPLVLVRGPFDYAAVVEVVPPWAFEGSFGGQPAFLHHARPFSLFFFNPTTVAHLPLGRRPISATRCGFCSSALAFAGDWLPAMSNGLTSALTKTTG